MTSEYAGPSTLGTTMPDMTSHRKTRRDHLWVLVIVAICALTEVWASWVTIGGMSGFPMIGGKHGFSTDWTLAVTTETYWAYALYGWLAAAPGPRSRKFAMWSAIGVFTLSLIGQGASHLVTRGTTPPPVLVVFVTSLPVIVLALIAILVHLRHADRAADAEREREAVEATELAKARAELAGERRERMAAEAARDTARQEAADTAAKVEALTRKLAGNPDAKGTRKPPRKPAGNPAVKQGNPGPVNDEAGEGDGDVDREALVLKYLAEGYSASKAGLKAGLSDSRGRQIARDLAKAAPKGGDGVPS